MLRTGVVAAAMPRIAEGGDFDFCPGVDVRSSDMQLHNFAIGPASRRSRWSAAART